MSRICVIVDKGHTAKTIGATGSYSYPNPYDPEKVITGTLTEYAAVNDIGTAFKNALHKKFSCVYETRRYKDLTQRLKEGVKERFENVNTQALVVALVSVHLNAGGDSGTEVFHSSDNPKSKELAGILLKHIIRCAEGFAEKRELGDVDRRWKDRGVKTEADLPGREWALGLIQWQGVPIYNEKGEIIDYTGRGKKAGLEKTFYDSCFYAVLVEVGFMDSAHDMKVIGQPLFGSKSARLWPRE